MKLRQGFVSNSSSTAFILDLRDERVKRAVEGSTVSLAQGLGRGSAIAVGKDAVRYAEEWVESTKKWYKDGGGLGHWILEWAEQLGENNIVFVRESDEDDGIDFHADYLAVSEREYH